MSDANEATGGGGSLGATYDDTGDLNGPDSPAGGDAAARAPQQGQGDDLAGRLGGGEGRGAGASGDPGAGDLGAGSSEESAARPAAAGIGEDPGGPGGMGGAGAAGGTGTGRPPGGLSPIGAEEKEAEDVR
jgi:hypothetical protein